jgi:uncharacterized protein
MTTKIFINLPVKDLKKSIDFFTKLGFTFNPQFTNEEGTCMIINDESFIMLLVEKFFKTFTKKEICDSAKSTEVIIAISAESKEKVDQLVNKAMDSGATKYSETQDQGWMYQRSFQDIDGHLWEVVYMDMSKAPMESYSASK